MRYSIFGLHDPAEDFCLRRCLRAYSIVTKTENSTLRDQQAQRIHRFLSIVNKRLTKRYGFGWKKQWISKLGFNVRPRTVDDWLLCRTSIPLVALECLKEFGLTSEVNRIEKQICYISSTTQEITRLPRILSPDLLYLCGLVLGDGCLPIKHNRAQNNLTYLIAVISRDRDFLSSHVSPLFKELFEVFPCSIVSQHGGDTTWILTKGNKAIFRFLRNIIQIPSGKKAVRARIPPVVSALPPKSQLPFLAGLIDSDIGSHGKGMGTTFRSKELVSDLILLLGQLGILAKTGPTYYKNGIYPQHDFSIRKSQMGRLKELMVANYLPKSSDRKQLLLSFAGV